MASEERVVLVAQLRDELSAPLNTASQAVDGVVRSTERARGANGRYVRTVQDTTAATNRARDANGRFTRTIEQVTGNSDRATGGMGRFRRAVQQVTDGVRTAGGTIRADLAKPLGAAGNAVKSFAGGALKTVGLVGSALGGLALFGGISRSLNIEQAQAKLMGLGHSAASVDQIMKNASASVKGTAFGLGDAATVAAGAVAAGIKPGKELERVLKLVGDGATIAGMEMGTMGSIFNKVAASGKLQGDVIAQLQDAGVPILQLVAKQMGVTAAEAAKMASDGKVSFETFTKAMEAGLGGAALKSGGTFKGALANTRAALGRIGETIATPFLGFIKAGFNAAIPLFDSLNAALKPVMTGFGTRMDTLQPKLKKWGAGLTGIINLVRGDFTSALNKAFGWDEDSTIVDFILTVREDLGKLMPLLAPILGWFVAMGSTSLAGLLGPLGRFVPVLNPVVGILAGLIASSPELRAALGDAFQALLPVLNQFSTAMLAAAPVVAAAVTEVVKFAAVVLEKLNPALPVLVPLVLGLVVALKVAGIAQAAWTVATTLWTAAQIGFQTALGVNTTLTTAQTAATKRGTNGFIVMKTAQYGLATAMGVATAATWLFNAGLKGIGLAIKSVPVIGWIIAAITVLVGVLTWFFTKTELGKSIVANAWAFIQSVMAAVVAWWRSTLKPAIQAIGKWFADVFTNIGNWFRDFIGFFVDGWGMIVDFWNGILLPIIAAIGKWFGDVFTNIGNWFRDFIGFFVDGWGMIVDFWNGILFPIIKAVGDVFAAVFGFIGRFIFNAIVIWVFLFGKLKDFWASNIQPALNSLGGWFADIFDWIGTVIGGFVGMVVDFFGMLTDWWNNTLSPALTVLGQWFSDVFDWIGGLIGGYIGMWLDFFGMLTDWWNTTLSPALAAIGQWFSDVFTWIGGLIAGYIGMWMDFFGMLVDWWNGVLLPALGAVGQWFSDIFTSIWGVISPIIGWIVGLFVNLVSFWNTNLMPVAKAVGGWFTDIIGGAISGVSGFIGNLRTGFDKFITFWSNTLKPVVDAIGAAFKVVGDIIDGALDGLKDFVNNPLGGVQDFLGIKKDKNGQGVMPAGSGGMVLPFAGGGVLSGYGPGIDRIPAILSPGESVLVPEATRAIGPANILAINHAASGGRAPGSTAGFSRAAPPPLPAPSNGGGVSTSFTIESLTITTQPGQSNEDIGALVVEKLEEAFADVARRAY